MGLDADVICVGIFSKDIAAHLDYEDEAYENVEEGRVVVTDFFGCNTSSQSVELADALGVDANDFNTHAIPKDRDIDWDALSLMCEKNGAWDYGIEGFKLLLKEKNFLCVYRPNR